MDEILIEEYQCLLNDNDKKENCIQDYLEKNSQLIPLPILENHNLHMNVIISKFRLGNEAITDFAYLTKSTITWKVVLIEIENPHKHFFKNNNKKIEFTAVFNNAIDQIREWKVYLNKNKEIVLGELEKLRVPLETNPVTFSYVLIYGRKKELETSEKRRNMLSQKIKDEGIEILNFDSLISRYSSFIGTDNEKLILSQNKEKGFSIKHLPKGKINTELFSYIYPDYLYVKKEYKNRLMSEGYEISEWERGNLLTLNCKKSLNSSSIREALTKGLKF